MLDNNDVLKLARNAVEKMFLEKGREFTFPFDLIWQYTEDESQIPSTARPHQVKRLLSEEYIEKTGGITRALSSKRAGSATPEYRFGRALRDKLLKFIVVENLPTLDETNIFPIIFLQKKDWDDFGYRTAYEATLAISPQKSVSLGDIKILIGNTPSEQSKLPDTFFSMHSHKFCSLGQSIEYYKNVAALDSDIRNPRCQNSCRVIR
ncbi:hypothetical protein [Undibacterium sp. TC9W]|uniref:hypothetical protein n=1 Tax=Undibacterium sp. TC9W TaxID=3413053 RepID=UPI003BF4002A